MPTSGILSLEEKVTHTEAAPQIRRGTGLFTPDSPFFSAVAMGVLHHFQRLVASRQAAVKKGEDLTCLRHL